jgi:hypothetical protein
MGVNWPSHWYGEGVWNLPDRNYPCGKRKYETKGEAKLAIKRLRAAKKDWERKAFKPTAYKCKNCGLWHWGHDRSRPRRGQRDDRAEGESAERFG